eukprot:TRINITY_DN616_c0_g1_i1.p1 TRINITY_DN616_c0_g1~~TRINITY_DN616_c0_g1_i1.p1  ORF type:complete len:192 (-),score=48.95 TRINITY_DN616_c0_g1_i1:119-694(-)
MTGSHEHHAAPAVDLEAYDSVVYKTGTALGLGFVAGIISGSLRASWNDPPSQGRTMALFESRREAVKDFRSGKLSENLATNTASTVEQLAKKAGVGHTETSFFRSSFQIVKQQAFLVSATAGAYAFVEASAENFRGKKDPLNQALGACASGLVLGAKAGSVSMALGTCGAFAAVITGVQLTRAAASGASSE